VTRQVLFVQGAGDGTHDEWDDKLVASLRQELGDAFDVRYPRLPDEDDPKASVWIAVIQREIESLERGAVLVGHSVGGAILIHALDGDTTDTSFDRPLGAIILLAAPFVGPGGWPAAEFGLWDETGGRPPADVPVYLFHGTADDTVPPAHAELYAKAIPQAQVRLLPGRDHQLENDLAVVAEVIRGLPPVRPAPGR
jgi:predicted alpha/beta hydrolase family esterase